MNDEHIPQTCKKCRSWTENKDHKYYKCYTNKCPAYIRADEIRNGLDKR